MALPREMEGVLQMHGNEWRDGIAPNVNNLNVIGKNILDFLHFKSSVN